MNRYIEQLSDNNCKVRSLALENIRLLIQDGKISPHNMITDEVNNHVHTWYSFSPYSPSMAAYKAWDAGLQVCGIVDHESVAGALEMRNACSVFGLGSTVGTELRVNFFGTEFEDKKLNNPDMSGVAYSVIHGISDVFLTQVDEFLQPIRKARMIRSEHMANNVSELLQSIGVNPISFEHDVIPLSLYYEGGEITERHILFACVKEIVKTIGKGKRLVDYLEQTFTITLNGTLKDHLLDEHNTYYEYDLLGILKSNILRYVYILPTENECVPVGEFVSFARSINAIPAYAYLGDIEDSVTGDKQAEKFEDEYLEQLVPYLAQVGYTACTYMPPRNTIAQLNFLSNLCKMHNLIEISGVDINSPRQDFLSTLPKSFEFLKESAWALVGHEYCLTHNKSQGLYGYDNMQVAMRELAHMGKSVTRA